MYTELYQITSWCVDTIWGENRQFRILTAWTINFPHLDKMTGQCHRCRGGRGARGPVRRRRRWGEEGGSLYCSREQLDRNRSRWKSRGGPRVVRWGGCIMACCRTYWRNIASRVAGTRGRCNSERRWEGRRDCTTYDMLVLDWHQGCFQVSTHLNTVVTPKLHLKIDSIQNAPVPVLERTAISISRGEFERKWPLRRAGRCEDLYMTTLP